MRFLQWDGADNYSLTGDRVGSNLPRYAILSHTWGMEEVTFKDMVNGTGKTKIGFNKIQFCGEQASRDNLKFFWVDTCCIDKSDSVELQEAINSMYRWYRNAEKCYVYLSDVSIADQGADKISAPDWESQFLASRWFTRGWTLQELLAPKSVEFFERESHRLGDKKSLERQIHERTRIAVSALHGISLASFSVDERFKWAEDRETTREEDWAYSLFGIFGIFMPLLYGEGRENAAFRLRREISDMLRYQDVSDHATGRSLAPRFWFHSTLLT
ncbi:HET-domain-containing protein [Xylariaceae sp. AK1471]|nr:HET-domain-containing protein [Xylariaceae sp. AK1471]